MDIALRRAKTISAVKRSASDKVEAVLGDRHAVCGERRTGWRRATARTLKPSRCKSLWEACVIHSVVDVEARNIWTAMGEEDIRAVRDAHLLGFEFQGMTVAWPDRRRTGANGRPRIQAELVESGARG